MEEGEATPKGCSQVRVAWIPASVQGRRWARRPESGGISQRPCNGHGEDGRTQDGGAARRKGARAVGETPTVVSDDGEGGVGSNGGGERGA